MHLGFAVAAANDDMDVGGACWPETAARHIDVRTLRSVPTPVADTLMARGCRSAGDILAKADAVQAVLSKLNDPEPQRKARAMVDGCRREVTNDTWGQSNSALELLQQAQAQPPIILPCEGIGRLLGTALRPGAALLEICGLPGAGKTQLCQQLCAAAQIPILSRSVTPRGAGQHAAAASSDIMEAIYIDSEGSFGPQRYAQICRAMLRERRPTSKQPEVEATSLERVLRNLHVCRTYDAAELYSTLKLMGGFLRKHPRVRVLVVDSVAFCFRHEFMDNLPHRARVLIDIAAMLRRYGAEYGLVVVVTNHMTTKFDRSSDNDNGWLAPALGDTWAHQPSTQIRLERVHHSSVNQVAHTGGLPNLNIARHIGRATLTKSVEQASGRNCTYSVSEDGVRDLDTAGAQTSFSSSMAA